MAYDAREWGYKYYVSDSLQCIPQNKYMAHSLREVLQPAHKVDKRSGDDIAMDVIRKAGLMA